MRECCHHCTLPLGGRVVTAEVGGVAHRFCCYGCLLAHQVTRASGEDGEASSIVIRLGLAIFLAMNVMMMSMPGYAPLIYGADAAAFDGPIAHVLRWLAMVFALPVLALLGWPVLRSFALGGWSGGPVADALVLLGTAAAFTLSIVRTVAGSGAVYFDTAVMVLLFVTFGRYLEARARADAGRAIRADLVGSPTRATRIVGTGLIDTAVADLAPEDIVRVVAGEMFPTDGVVLSGSGWVDEALMTGESRMISHRPGSAVAGGTCSVDGCFEVRVVRPAALSAAARIEALLEAARRTASPLERLAEKYARVFLPTTVAIALAAGVWHGWSVNTDAGILAALSVLVVACPCALGIATPVALWFGVVAAARRGIILRDASVLERANRIERVYLDKTGTLTQRTPRLLRCEAAADSPWTPEQLLRRVASLERGQHHPIARATMAAAGLFPVDLPVSDVVVDAGRGIRGLVDGEPMAVGSRAYGEVATDPAFAAEEAGSVGEVYIWSDNRCVGRMVFAEEVRADAAAAVMELRETLALRVGVLSGDSSTPSGAELGLGGLSIESGLSPDDKLARVRAAVDKGRRSGAGVAFVGDGVNDAPALAAADLGIAFGEPADLPRTAADALCITDELLSIPWLLLHARHVVGIVRQNLAIAFGYNAVAVAFAAAGKLDPLIAAAAMLGSSLLVVANARRAGSRRSAALAVRPDGAAGQASWMPSSSSLR